jgi:hypothetical protein
MSETPKNFGFGLLAVVPIVCCIGLPLLVAAGVSVALAAWAGGIALAVLAVGTVVALLVVWERRPRRS